MARSLSDKFNTRFCWERFRALARTNMYIFLIFQYIMVLASNLWFLQKKIASVPVIYSALQYQDETPSHEATCHPGPCPRSGSPALKFGQPEPATVEVEQPYICLTSWFPCCLFFIGLRTCQYDYNKNCTISNLVFALKGKVA